MVNTWKPILAALVIFAAGVITGSLLVGLRQRAFHREFLQGDRTPRTERLEPGNPNRLAPPIASEPQLRELAQRMARSLDLSKEQNERIQDILKETQGRMRTIAEEFNPRTREELRHMRERIRNELSPAQRRRFEDMLRPREGRMRRLGNTNTEAPLRPSPGPVPQPTP